MDDYKPKNSKSKKKVNKAKTTSKSQKKNTKSHQKSKSKKKVNKAKTTSKS